MNFLIKFFKYYSFREFFYIIVTSVVFWGIGGNLLSQNFWQPAGFTGHSFVRTFAVNSKNYLFASYDGRGIARSLDNGATWNKLTIGLPFSMDTWSLAANGSTLLAGTSQSGIYLSTDDGNSWTQIDSTFPDPANRFTSVAINNIGHPSGGVTFFAASSTGLYRSIDSGKTWTRQTNGFAVGDTSPTIVAVNKSGVLFVQARRIYRSTDNGQTWSRLTNGIYSLYPLSFLITPKNQTLLAVLADLSFQNTYLYKSIDNGNSWDSVSVIGLRVFLANDSDMIFNTFHDSTGYHIYRSTDYGTSWRELSNKGLPRDTGWTGAQIIDHNGFCYLYLNRDVVYRSVGSTFVVSVKEIPLTTLSSTLLEQNYPNPCSATTSIRFTVPQYQKISIILYDIFGREIEKIQNKEMDAGTYEITLGNLEVRNGVYTYVLVGENIIQARRMTVTK